VSVIVSVIYRLGIGVVGFLILNFWTMELDGE
jgi:hypothetical protein